MVVHQSGTRGRAIEARRRSAEELAQAVIGYYLDHQARFVEAVKRGFDSPDRGDFVSHGEVGARSERLFQP
jgi:predicted transcriptional regulator